ncbi:hypothetical protein, partial [Massilia sp. CT11-108]|uniref:hypothetical protein n=1 Tax=Massilia sp. CT11-108 TaxID=3393900 RepID=UPI0039A76D11
MTIGAKIDVYSKSSFKSLTYNISHKKNRHEPVVKLHQQVLACRVNKTPAIMTRTTLRAAGALLSCLAA